MEYQKIIIFLNNAPNQRTRFGATNWVEINDEERGAYNTNSETEFRTLMLRSSLCHYSDSYILLKGTILIAAQAEKNPNNGNKKVVSKSCASFTDCKSEINSTEIGMLNTLI